MNPIHSCLSDVVIAQDLSFYSGLAKLTQEAQSLDALFRDSRPCPKYTGPRHSNACQKHMPKHVHTRKIICRPIGVSYQWLCFLTKLNRTLTFFFQSSFSLQDKSVRLKLINQPKSRWNLKVAHPNTGT